MTLLVTGTIDLDPAQADAFTAAAAACMAASQAEEACEGYALSADLSVPGRFHLLEQWASPEGFAAHNQTEHLATFMGVMKGSGLAGLSLTMWSGGTPTKLA